MSISARMAAVALLAGTAFALPAAHAREDLDPDVFVKKCDTDKDGMLSRAEVMKQVEKAFERHDTWKSGKLDKRQVEFFLQELMKSGA